MTNESLPGQDVLGLLATTQVPEIQWVHGDDECDCIFQRIGQWRNPYLGRTLRIRMCCIWAELYKQYPQFVQEIPAYYDLGTDRFITEPQDWNSEDMDMPRALWYRQLAIKYQKSLPEIRALCDHLEPPKKVAKGTGVSFKRKET